MSKLENGGAAQATEIKSAVIGSILPRELLESREGSPLNPNEQGHLSVADSACQCLLSLHAQKCKGPCLYIRESQQYHFLSRCVHIEQPKFSAGKVNVVQRFPQCGPWASSISTICKF